MKDFIPKIGLEIHLELATQTKLFCSCKNDPYETEPNKNICEICTGQPGVLPVLNKQAVIYAYSLAKALKMKINNPSYFARKHYFYPDLPKNYQITQHNCPLGENGVLEIFREKIKKTVRIRKIHLEEDAGRNLHFAHYSLVDYNRAGVPLIELVTEPDLRSSEEAEALAEEFVLLVRYLGISEADAEKGQIRFEANVSLGPGEELGTKVEIKNINSIRALVDAIDYEIERQLELLEEGKAIIQETRGFDDLKRITFSQRTKEEAEDYRYFPEPDLPPLVIDEEIEKNALRVETPTQYKKRLMDEYGLSWSELEVMVRNPFLGHFFEEAYSELIKMTPKLEEAKKLTVNFLLNDLWGMAQKLNLDFNEALITPHEFAHLIYTYFEGKISSRIVKEALDKALRREKRIEDVIKESEMITNPEALAKIIDEVLEENNQSVKDYLEGKTNALEYLIGQVMKKTKGKADPKVTRELMLDKLKRRNEH